MSKALIDFMTRHIDPAVGLVQFGYYGDWVALKSTPKPAVSSFSFILAVSRVAEMAAAVGATDDAHRYTSALAAYKAAWHRAYYSNGTYAGDSQTGNAMALYIDIPPSPAIKAATVSALLADYRRAKNHPTFGTVGARIFLPVLADNGQMDLAIDFATLTTQPSYGFMVEQGPGTIWENWGGDAHNAAGSKNHPMFCGGLGVFLYRRRDWPPTAATSVRLYD